VRREIRGTDGKALKKGYWPNKLSSMVLGLDKTSAPTTVVREYEDIDEVCRLIKEFVGSIKEKRPRRVRGTPA